MSLTNYTETLPLPTISPMYNAFLSHNSADKPMVEAIAIRLEDEMKLVPFLDKWHLVPGEPWQEELEKALDESETCVVFLGPSGLGPWQNEEMRTALDERVRNGKFRVIPVLLPLAELQNSEALPRFLRRLTWVDFRAGLDNDEEFHRLAAGIKGQRPGRQLAQEKTVTWVLVLSGTVNDIDKPKIEAIAEHLRQITGDFTLTINKVETGSIKLAIESSEDGLNKIKSLLMTGNLNHLLDYTIIKIQESDETVIYAPMKRSGGFKLYVGNISFNTSDQDLEELFGQVGTVQSANIVEDRETGRSRGFGFVEMSSKEEGNAAIEQLNGKEVDGRELKVNEANPRENRSRGAFGGSAFGGGRRGGRGGRGSSGGGGGQGALS